MASLQEDTLADKLVRLVIGAAVGFFLTGLFAWQCCVGVERAFTSVAAVGALVAGVGAVLFGNSFIEGAFREWWRD